jgi:hypothetical protein
MYMIWHGIDEQYTGRGMSGMSFSVIDFQLLIYIACKRGGGKELKLWRFVVVVGFGVEKKMKGERC